MANIITTLKQRMISDRDGKSFPCKVYKSEANAEKALAAEANKVGKRLDTTGNQADYLVFFIAEWDVWVGAINMTELTRRATVTGGFIGTEFYQF